MHTKLNNTFVLSPGNETALSGIIVSMSFLAKIFGDPNEREIKKDRVVVEKINALEEDKSINR